MTCKSCEHRSMGFGSANFDCSRYPPKMIPGCHITIHTTAKTDRESRLLLSAIGIPFTGKLVD